MPIDLFQPFTNPITGETFRCLSSSEEAYVMEWTVAPDGFVPFEHLHLAQDEVFTVQAGCLRLVLNGQEQMAHAGETVTVTKGARHIAFNAATQPLVCVVEYRPGLDLHLIQQCVAGLILAGDYDAKGTPNIPKLGYCIKGLRCITRPTQIPAFAFGAALEVFYAMGVLLGWERLYKEYTGLERVKVLREGYRR